MSLTDFFSLVEAVRWECYDWYRWPIHQRYGIKYTEWAKHFSHCRVSINCEPTVTRTRARQLNWGLKLFDSGLGSICRGEFGKSSKCVYNWIKFGPVFYSKRNVELRKYNASFILMLWNEHLICSCYWNYTVCVAPMEKREILHIFYVLQIELLFALLFGRVDKRVLCEL